MDEGEKKYETAARVTLKLTELGSGESAFPGRFGGRVRSFKSGKPVDQTDQVLTAAVDDDLAVISQ